MNRSILILLLASAIAANAQTNAMPEPEANSAVPPPAPAAPVKSRPPPAEIKPTELTFDTGKFNFKSNIFVYTGNVRVDNPQMLLTAEKLTLESPRIPNGKFDQATAEGNVVIDFLDDKGLTNHATASKAIYTFSVTNAVTNAFVDLIGNAVVTDPEGRRIEGNIRWDRIENTVSVTEKPRIIVPPGTSTPDLIGPLRQKTNAAPATTNNLPE